MSDAEEKLLKAEQEFRIALHVRDDEIARLYRELNLLRERVAREALPEGYPFTHFSGSNS